MSPHFFLLGFVFGKVSKPNMTFVTFCVKNFSCYMLHIAMLILKQSLVWYHWLWYFYDWLWEDWAEWHNWQKSQGNSHQQTRNQLGTRGGAKNFQRHKFYVESMYENNGYACNTSKSFFQGRRKFLQVGEVLPLVTGLVTRWLGMQTSHCRLDWYMSNGYVFRKTSDSFSFGYLDIFSSWLG